MTFYKIVLFAITQILVLTEGYGKTLDDTTIIHDNSFINKRAVIQCNADWITAPNRHRYYIILCNNAMTITAKYRQGTRCKFSCKDKYYQKSGSTSINCLKNGNWDASPIQCEVIKCPQITRTSNFIHTRVGKCFSTEAEVGERCEFGCTPGFKLVGSPVIECMSKKSPVGQWNIDVTKSSPKCLDVERPRFSRQNECDNGIDIVTSTEPNQNYALVMFDKIAVTDNSGHVVSVECVTGNDQACKYQMGKQYNIGTTSGLSIRFKATDREGNYQFCRFRVTVKDVQKPTLLQCPQNILIETSKNQEHVTWSQPKYADNSNKSIRITSNLSPGSQIFVNTKFLVEYVATDAHGNVNRDCAFTIAVTKKVVTCPKLNVPVNGLLMYDGGVAQMFCQQGYFPDGPIAFIYLCINRNSQWMDPGWGVITKLPDCLKKTPSQQRIASILTFNGNCVDAAVAAQMKIRFSTVAGADKSKVSYNCGSRVVV